DRDRAEADRPEEMRVRIAAQDAARVLARMLALAAVVGRDGITSSAAIAWWVASPSNFGKLAKSARARARASEASARFSASTESNCIWARKKAPSGLVGNGSSAATGRCRMRPRRPGKSARIAAWRVR